MPVARAVCLSGSSGLWEACRKCRPDADQTCGGQIAMAVVDPRERMGGYMRTAAWCGCACRLHEAAGGLAGRVGRVVRRGRVWMDGGLAWCL